MTALTRGPAGRRARSDVNLRPGRRERDEGSLDPGESLLTKIQHRIRVGRLYPDGLRAHHSLVVGTF
jgi:hypothetical protein